MPTLLSHKMLKNKDRLWLKANSSMSYYQIVANNLLTSVTGRGLANKYP